MQAVDHPYLVVYSASSGENANLNGENKKEQECGLCHESAEDSVVSVSIFSIYCYFAVSELWFLFTFWSGIFQISVAGLTYLINILLWFLNCEGDFLCACVL